MEYLRSGAAKLLQRLVTVSIAGLLISGSITAIAKSSDDLDIITVSTRPDTVSGGNVLVRINAPRGIAIDDLAVFLNGQAVTSAFRPEAGGRSLLGLVEGLQLGENTLVAKAVGRDHETDRSARLSLTNYPITGQFCRGHTKRRSTA